MKIKLRLNSKKFILSIMDFISIVICCGVIHGMFFLLLRDNMVVASEGINVFSMAFPIVSVMCVFLFGGYKEILRYSNAIDLAKISCGIVLGAILSDIVSIVASLPLLTNPADKSYSDFIKFQCAVFIILILSLLATMGSRIIYCMARRISRISKDKDRKKKKRTLIVGAGETCKIILGEMESEGSIYYPVCIVDDNTTKISRAIDRIPIYGPTDYIPDICMKNEIEVIVFAIPSCDEENKKRILNVCYSTGRDVLVLPNISKLILHSNDLQLLKQAKKLQMEDLLGRDPIKFDKTALRNLIENKVCMVTGGGGSIGSELCRQIAKYNPKKLIIIDIYENTIYDIQQELKAKYNKKLNFEARIASVREYNKMASLFEEFKPQLVFHAAAHKHVPLMEDSPEEAVKNNVFGTFNVAMLADFYKADKFVMISTDKAVNPTNVMGATKRICEMIVQYMAQISTQTEFVAVRFGNVLGSNGSVIPLFCKQIEAGGPVTVTHPDIIRYFMTIPEAVSLVLQAGNMAKGSEIFVLDMGEPVKITTLAENLIRTYGKEPYKDIDIEFTGLRPGEKLFEELLMDEEGLQNTVHDKIFVGNQIIIEPNEFITQLKALKEIALNNETENVVDMIEQMVPTFKRKTKRNPANEKNLLWHKTLKGDKEWKIR